MVAVVVVVVMVMAVEVSNRSVDLERGIWSYDAHVTHVQVSQQRLQPAPCVTNWEPETTPKAA